ncbi:NAD(P)/FAD-dependent oxidoreductase [Candidatus Micrarchaeota archaeon]|nr:NAD(P)/FAD-dependent oxidoreductase [Candidatus Micrarchaeota archaeon]MBI5176831.1 NAD(P)/FAD-dependent oxidoreductase [Candidatus Micrarchaeota archaeon]
MAGDFDAIIVGGGPGGSSCAAFLSQMGRKVLLLDKANFPRDKTCGDGISGKSLRALKELGVTDRIERAPHGKITGVTFSSPDGTVIDIPLSKSTESNPEKIEYGYCARREVFDAILFENAKKLATRTLEGFTVTDLVWEGEGTGARVVGVKGTAKTGGEMEFRGNVVVGADGANSVVAAKVGVKETDAAHLCSAIRCYYNGVAGMKGNIELHFFNELLPGYFWIFPLENGMANIGAGMIMRDMQRKKISLKDAMFRAIESNPLVKERFKDAKMVPNTLKGWNLPFGSKHWKAHGNGWVLIGDAASLVDPFTGEGIGNALVSGKLAASAINEACSRNDFTESQLSGYEKVMRAEFDPELQTSYKLQKRGTNKFLLNLFMHKAASNAEFRDMIAGTLTDTSSRKRYVSPLFYLKVLLTPPYW